VPTLSQRFVQVTLSGYPSPSEVYPVPSISFSRRSASTCRGSGPVPRGAEPPGRRPTPTRPQIRPGRLCGPCSTTLRRTRRGPPGRVAVQVAPPRVHSRFRPLVLAALSPRVGNASPGRDPVSGAGNARVGATLIVLIASSFPFTAARLAGVPVFDGAQQTQEIAITITVGLLFVTLRSGHLHLPEICDP
jgi:hypothetical protein